MKKLKEWLKSTLDRWDDYLAEADGPLASALSEAEPYITGALIVGAVLALAVIATILNGWVLTWLWAWFVVPFFKLPQLTIPQAVGLGIIVSFVTSGNKKEDFDGVSHALGHTFGLPLLVLLFGWIVQLFL